MKLRLRNIILLFILSLSLNGSTNNISFSGIGENGFAINESYNDNPQVTKIDCTVVEKTVCVTLDSIPKAKDIKIQHPDSLQPKEKTGYITEHTSENQSKTTMIELLIRWIVLLLEVS